MAAEGYLVLSSKQRHSDGFPSVPGSLDQIRGRLFPTSRLRRFDRTLTVGWSLHIFVGSGGGEKGCGRGGCWHG